MESNADNATTTTSKAAFLRKNGPYKKKTFLSIYTHFMAVDGHSSPNSYPEGTSLPIQIIELCQKHALLQNETVYPPPEPLCFHKIPKTSQRNQDQFHL
jgi:hypothetical protein